MEKFLGTKPIWRDRFLFYPQVLAAIDVFLNGLLFGAGAAAGAALPLGIILWLTR